jgi:hypothetical protein
MARLVVGYPIRPRLCFLSFCGFAVLAHRHSALADRFTIVLVTSWRFARRSFWPAAALDPRPGPP